MKKIIFLSAALALLAGCATVNEAASLKGTVLAHHQWQAGLPRSFTVVAQGEQVNSLAFAEQKTAVENNLSRWAFTPLSEAESKTDKTALRVSFKLLETKQTVVVQRTEPLYGTLGWGYSRPGVGVGVNVPLFPPPLHTHTQTREVNVPSLALTIDGADGKRLYEGKITLAGAGKTPLEAIPRLIDGLMQNFPGESGKATQVGVK